MAGGAWEYMMSGIDDGTGSGKLASGRHNVYNSGFIGKITCPECNDNGVEVNHDITEVTEGIALPTDDRFYDIYDYSKSNSTFNRGKIGDATKEVGPFQNMKYLTISRNVGSWHDDDAVFPFSGVPWFTRGGEYYCGSNTGMFSFSNAYGAPSRDSFRLVLAF